MRIALVLLTAAACGSNHSLADSALADAPPADAAIAIDASPCAIAACDPNATCTVTGDSGACACNPGYQGDGHTCSAVAVALQGLRWEIPCGGDLSSVVCGVTDPAAQTATLTGATGTTYQVALRFRGVIEQKTYSGGTVDGYFVTGGADNGDAYNVYELAVSSPAQSYFLNAGSSGITNCWVIDYTKTIPIDAGATLTLTAASKDAQEIKNIDPNGTPLVVPDVPPAPAAYNGQFIQMDVVSVTAP
jgi:hypothetical protein